MSRDLGGEQKPQTVRASSVTQTSARDSEMVRRHARQRVVSMLASPIWVPATVLIMRFYFRYRIINLAELRRQ